MRKTLFVAPLALLLAGCPRGDRVKPTPVMLTTDKAALLAAHNRSADALASFSADLRMTFYYVEDGKTKSRTTGAWLDIEKPSRLRLKHDDIGRELFYALTDGQTFWIGLDRALTGDEDTLYTGPLDALADRYIMLSPASFLAVGGLPHLPPDGAPRSVFLEFPDTYVFHFLPEAEPLGISATAVFSRRDLRLSEYLVFDGQGRLALRAQYEKYFARTERAIPERVLISWPEENTSVLVRYSDVRTGILFPAEMWRYRWRTGAKTIDITDEP